MTQAALAEDDPIERIRESMLRGDAYQKRRPSIRLGNGLWAEARQGRGGCEVMGLGAAPPMVTHSAPSTPANYYAASETVRGDAKDG